MDLPRIQSLDLISKPDAQILILGSMPGQASLEAQEYYAYKHNSFWRIMGELVGAGPDKPYAERTQILRDRGIALWDVIHNCIRQGSSDSKIKDAVPQDFAEFFDKHKHIRYVGLNGTTAERLFKKFTVRHCPSSVIFKRLPSTSPAYRRITFEEKCAAWRALPI